MAKLNMDAYEEALKDDLVSYLKKGKGIVKGVRFIVETDTNYSQPTYMLYLRKDGITKLMNKRTDEGHGYYSTEKWSKDQLYENVHMIIRALNIM